MASGHRSLRTPVRHVVVATALALLASVAACADDPPPQGARIDARVDVAPQGGPPDVPKQLSLTESGAKFFVGYWVDAYNYGLKSGRTKLLRGMSSADCLPCVSLADAIEDAHAGKAEVRTVGVDTVPMEVDLDRKARTAQVKYFVMRFPIKIKRGKQDVQKVKAGVSPIRFDLVRVRKTWQVSNLELVPVEKGTADEE